MDEYSYLNTSNGLTDKTFSTTMSKGEYICLVANYLRAYYLEYIESEGCYDLFSDTSDITITTVSNAGNIKLSEVIAWFILMARNYTSEAGMLQTHIYH